MNHMMHVLPLSQKGENMQNGKSLEEVRSKVAESHRFTGDVFDKNELPQVDDLGKGFALVSERKVDFTYDLAEKLLGLPELPMGDIERRLRDNHVTHLNNEMQMGNFRWELVQLITCTCDESDDPKQEYRMNGQHTCWARILLPPKIQAEQVHLMKYRCRTIEDVRVLYTTIDQGAARTKQHTIVAMLSGRQEFKTINKRILALLADGLSMWLYGVQHEGYKRKVREIAQMLLTTHHELAIKVSDFLARSMESAQGHVRRGPVVAAMFETFSKVPTKAEEFWAAVRDGLGITEKADPRKTLADGLRNSSVEGRGINTKLKPVSREAMYRWCIQAWNAWRKEQTLRTLRFVPNDKRPKAL